MTPGAALETVFAWLLRSSLQASVLILVVLVIRDIVGWRISARWRSALWLLVLLRLILPWAPETRLSPYSLIPDSLLHPLARHTTSLGLAPQRSGVALGVLEAAAPQRLAPARSRRASFLPLLWGLGATAFAAWLLAQTLSTLLAFRGRRPVTEKPTLDLLEDCKADLGVHTYLALVETPRTKTPALLGWIRPRLLLPEGLLATLGREQLRHVFLHELAHLKRHDVALNWLMAVIQILHWFNPLVWLALRQARADMELACDELALARLRGDAPQDYGNTIIELHRAWPQPRRLPALAALAEDATQTRKRIRWVAAFGRVRRASVLLPASIVLLLGAAFLPDASPAHPRQLPSLELQATSTAETIGGPHFTEAVRQAPPGDAAMDAAREWLAFFDAGQCSSTWDEAHSVARGLLSRQAWTGFCEELRRAETQERGRPVSRQVASREYVPNLPLDLGNGVSVRFSSRYDTGEYPGPRLLMAKDRDGRWRLVRSDKE